MLQSSVPITSMLPVIDRKIQKAGATILKNGISTP